MRFGINPTIQITGRSTDMAITAHDIVPDSPTNNFATLNPLDNASVLSDGSLVKTGNNTWRGTNSTFKLPSTSKWYFESSTSVISQRTVLGFTTDGISKTSVWQVTVGFVGLAVDQSSVNAQDNQSSYTVLWTKTGSFGIQMVLQMCVDCATGNVWFGYNGNWYDSTGSATGNPSAGTNPTTTLTTPIDWCPAIQVYDNTNDLIINFGQDPTFAGNKNTPATVNINGTNVTGPFAPSGTAAGTAGLFYYPPPAGALALCTANLPDFTPTVTGDVPADYFKTVLYTGNGGTQSITGVGFQSDLVWLKGRSYAEHHHLYDVVRGATKVLYSNRTVNEQTDTLGLTSFDADGFSIGSRHEINNSGDTFVAWCWKAGGAPSGSTSTTGSAKRINTSGTQDDTSCSALATAATNAGASNVITPTLMSINQAAGFSIVSYTGNNVNGATIPHGLNNPPEIIITKNRSISSEWPVAYVPTSISGYLNLPYSFAGVNFNDQFITAPTSTVFSAGTTAGYVNSNGNNHIAYCWHSVEGFSKFGSYSGSYSDFPYIYTGFKPAFVMIKSSSSDISGYGSWIIYDNARDPYNQMNKVLYANKSVGEGYRGNGTSTFSGLYLDFVSNGFKIRVAAGETNDSSEPTYIYAAFAEQPFKFSNAR